MMLQGSIRPYSREFVVDRRNDRLDAAWVYSNRAASMPSGLTWLTNLAPTAFRGDPAKPVLAMLNGSQDDAACKELLRHASTGSRVYVVVPEAWGAKDVDREWLSLSSVLIRRVREVPASAIHTASGARVWMGGPWHVRLDERQAAVLRQVFLRLFWHEAVEEAWTGGKQLVWRVAAERPFDVPDVCRSEHVRWGEDVRMEASLRDALVHWNGDVPPDERPRTLWIRSGPKHHDRLGRMVRDGVAVVWQDCGLPEMVVGGRDAQVLLGTGRARMRITLNADQSADAARILETKAQWSFRVNVRLGDPELASASFWLGDEKRERALEQEQEMRLADVVARSLRSVPEAEPSKWTAPQPLALSVRYAWTVVPPKLPAGASEDSLHVKWHKIDTEWTSRLRKVSEMLERAEENQGRIAHVFSSLAGALLGFGRTRQQLMTKVAHMETQRPSANGPSGAREMLLELANIEERANALSGDMEKAEADERLRQEEEKQRADWQGRVKSATDDLSGKRRSLADAERERDELETQVESIKEEKKTADDDAKKNLYAKEKKVSDDLQRAKKMVGKVRDDIRSLEERAAEEFRFRPPSGPAVRRPETTDRFVPKATQSRSAMDVPAEALPDVGVLRVLKGDRYLVIEDWGDLDAGELEAARLSAGLVAPEKI